MIPLPDEAQQDVHAALPTPAAPSVRRPLSNRRRANSQSRAESIQLLHELRRNAARVQQLAATVSAVAAAPDLTSAVCALMEGAVALLDGTSATVALYNRATGRRHMFDLWSNGEFEEQPSQEPPAPGTNQWRLFHGEGPILTEDYDGADPASYPLRERMLSLGVRSSANVPIDLPAAGGTAGTVGAPDADELSKRRIGSLHVNSAAPGHFTQEYLAILAALASQAAAAVERARLLTAEREARAAAEAAEQRLRGLVQGLGVVIWEGDAAFRPTFISERAEQLFGYPVSWWLTDPDCWAKSIHPDDYAGTVSARAAATAEGKDHELEYRMVTSGGDVLWVRDLVFVVNDERGRPTQVRGVILDVTERRRAADALLEAERRALQSEKLRALGQMASGIAHDLNQSLALIAGYGELARQRLDPAQPSAAGREELRAQLDETFAIISRAAMGGSETVKRLLTFARPRPEGPPEHVPLVALLREVAELTAPRWRDASQAEGRPISLLVEASPQVEQNLVVAGWPASLREALTNLVFNAVDALPHGGSIRLRARQAARSGTEALLEVIDSGIGMPPAVRARIFEPFFTTKGERGTGLGLATVFGVVERHGGHIEVDSVVGKGTTFRLVLPAAQGPARHADTEGDERPRKTTSRPLAILAVDDQHPLAEMVALMLAPFGHNVATAASGEEALETLTAAQADGRPFDLVVSDVGMGAGMNGWELADQVRRRFPRVTVCLATGWGAQIDPDEARAKGVAAVVAKPYRIAELQRVIEAAVPAAATSRGGAIGGAIT